MPTPKTDVNEIKRKITACKTEMRGICDDALKTNEKAMTEKQGARYQELEAECRSFEGQIQLIERQIELDKDDIDKQEENRSELPVDTRSLGEQLVAIRNAADPEYRAASGMNENIPSSGALLVGTDKITGIMKRMYDKSLIAGRCDLRTIGAGNNSVTWNELDESSRATGSRNGGVRVYRTKEAGTVDVSYPKMTERTLKAEKLMAIAPVTDELFQDAVGLENFIMPIFEDEMGYKIDEEIFNGTGGGECLGINNSKSVVSVDKRPNQVAATILYENILDMWVRLWVRSRADSVWYINQDCEKELATMALVIGAGGIPVYMPASGASGSPYSTLFGRPVIPVEQCKTVGTVGDIVLMDPSQYMLVQKGGINQVSSIHARFIYDERLFRLTYRINGMPKWNSPLTPANGSNTVSPTITLATRA